MVHAEEHDGFGAPSDEPPQREDAIVSSAASVEPNSSREMPQPMAGLLSCGTDSPTHSHRNGP